MDEAAKKEIERYVEREREKFAKDVDRVARHLRESAAEIDAITCRFRSEPMSAAYFASLVQRALLNLIGNMGIPEMPERAGEVDGARTKIEREVAAFEKEA